MSEQIEVTQADRDFAARWANIPQDHAPLARDAARHRTEARRAALEDLRLLVAALYCASGCSCCRDNDTWYASANALGRALNIPPYQDGSGYDFYAVRDENAEAIRERIDQ